MTYKSQMNELMNLQARRHGFRISFGDAVILAAGFAGTLWLRSMDFPLWWIVPMALGHFFLFCNVFLVWRKLELIWAAAFIVNVAIHVAFDDFDGLSALLWQSPMTILVILWQIRSPWYHGIFASRLNPRLQDYLEGRM